MKIKQIQDKNELFSFFSQDYSLYGYHIGDLDDFYFKNCAWYGLYSNNHLIDVILQYSALQTPSLLIFGQPNNIELMIDELVPKLPKEFFCHYFKDYESKLMESYNRKYLGRHIKMKQIRKNKITVINQNNIRSLTINDEKMIKDFYNVHYPGNYFDSRMLETRRYFGYFINDDLISIAGIHVYSPIYNVAVLGNIATNKNYRNKGYASLLINKLVSLLQNEVEFIGLNVKKDNLSAIKIYEKLGFIQTYEYEEALFYKE
jgi:ribosomal protein S18 acetylase RimI-like enzyme